jgi:hypothetical protein
MQLFLRGDPALARPSGPAAAMPANVSRTAQRARPSCLLSLPSGAKPEVRRDSSARMRSLVADPGFAP